MNKENIAITLFSIGGILLLVDIVAGYQANHNNGNMPNWYPDTLSKIEDTLPVSPQIILFGAGAALLYL